MSMKRKITLGVFALVGAITLLVAIGGAAEETTPEPVTTTTAEPVTTTEAPSLPGAELLAEYGGSAAVYERIAVLTDCGLLQEQFDIAAHANDTYDVNAPAWRWTLGYMEFADERLEAEGCY